MDDYNYIIKLEKEIQMLKKKIKTLQTEFDILDDVYIKTYKENRRYKFELEKSNENQKGEK